MRSFDYGQSRAAAERLIARFGQPGVLRRVVNSGADYDPAQTAEDFACLLVSFDGEEGSADGSLIARGDRTVYLSATGLPITPSLSDRLLIGGSDYAIIALQPLSPGGMAVLWQMQVRR